MTDPALKEALRRAYASAPAGEVTLHTLELRHPSFSTPIRVVRNFSGQERWLDQGGAEAEAALQNLSASDQNMVGLIARLEADAPVDAGQMVAWIALGFDMDLPPVESVPVPEITVTLDNVGREIITALDAAATSQDKIEVTYRPYLSTDLEAPQMDPPITLTLSDVEATPLTVTARARMLDIGNQAFPGRTYKLSEFPGLAR